MGAKLSSEFLGTFWLVLGGCGSVVIAGAFPAFGIGFVGVSLAFGLSVLSAAYALGPISGLESSAEKRRDAFAWDRGTTVTKRSQGFEQVPQSPSTLRRG